MVIKTVLIMMSAVILIITYFLFSRVREYHLIYLFTFIMIPAQSMLSVWFYTGMEEMKYLNYTNVVSRLGYLAGILLIIKTPEDFYLIPAVNSGAMLSAGVVSFWLIYHKFHIRFYLPSFAEISSALQDGWHVFISNLSITLYRNSNIFILGLLAPNYIVGFYSAGEKIVKIIQSIFTPITRVLYPYISRQTIKSPDKSLKRIRWLVILVSFATGIIFLILVIFTKPLTLLILGEGFKKSITVIKICSIAIMFGPVNYIIGIIFMLNFNMKSEFTKSVLLAGVVNVILCFFMSFYLYETGTAIVFVFTEIFLMISYLTYIYTKRDKWRTFNGA
jgi:PST family polysaccharide transporter